MCLIPRFDQCSISPLSLKGIKDAGYEKMTLVQEATLPLILKGKHKIFKKLVCCDDMQELKETETVFILCQPMAPPLPFGFGIQFS